MKLWTPTPPLGRWIEVIWLLDRRTVGIPGERELALPTGTVELVVDLDDDCTTVYPQDNLTCLASFRGPVVCGVHRRPFAIDSAKPARTLGVHFKPGGAAAFLHVPLHATEGQHVPLEDLVGPDARQLRDELGAARDDAAVFRTIEQFLVRSLRGCLPGAVEDALRQLGSGDRPTVKELVDASGYSHRRFNELFRTTVGLGAKQFSRVARFQHALRRVERDAVVDWQDVVSECGFYDQAHLIHEFRRHAGLTPTDYLARRGDRLNHPSA